MKLPASSHLKYFLLLSGLLVPVASVFAAEPSYEQAEASQNEIQDFVIGFKGVNGIGISKCSPKTGDRDLDLGEFCIVINTETKKAAAALKTLLPALTRYSDVLVRIEYIGRIGIEPRLGVGN